jgi:CubicO group peptidase (beta-lactamase class C family)
MTLADILTMRTGIRWDEESFDYTDPRNNCAVMEGKEDWVRYVLEQPMAEEPGKGFRYNSGATELLSCLLTKTTGKPADDYAKEHLFGPLGIKDFYWKRTPKGLADTEGGLYLAPRDLAKIGLLYMKDGVWGASGFSPRAGRRRRRPLTRPPRRRTSDTATSGGSGRTRSWHGATAVSS